ncbi:hypothetical protein [Paucibacter sp. XJ19-41]|uniref:hypothetical protein n=1 Tax=Paucibacter sp. XJ19-41 TaxID=2927824 RepID=UPI00234BA8F4|nr:hypothetical protein [Paucibacter sp. XJ19-41]MDC6169769.1 hypothetical protein [Paucibacter sp. XJ19-41]
MKGSVLFGLADSKPANRPNVVVATHFPPGRGGRPAIHGLRLDMECRSTDPKALIAPIRSAGDVADERWWPGAAENQKVRD